MTNHTKLIVTYLPIMQNISLDVEILGKNVTLLKKIPTSKLQDLGLWNLPIQQNLHLCSRA